MDDCIFCKIANKEIPTSLVYEDDLVAAFNDLSPQAPVHVLIVPKKHYQSVLEVPEGDKIVAHMFHVASKLAKELGIAENGFRLVINTGKDGGQIMFFGTPEEILKSETSLTGQYLSGRKKIEIP